MGKARRTSFFRQRSSCTVERNGWLSLHSWPFYGGAANFFLTATRRQHFGTEFFCDGWNNKGSVYAHVIAEKS